MLRGIWSVILTYDWWYFTNCLWDLAFLPTSFQYNTIRPYSPENERNLKPQEIRRWVVKNSERLLQICCFPDDRNNHLHALRGNGTLTFLPCSRLKPYGPHCLHVINVMIKSVFLTLNLVWVPRDSHVSTWTIPYF